MISQNLLSPPVSAGKVHSFPAECSDSELQVLIFFKPPQIRGVKISLESGGIRPSSSSSASDHSNPRPRLQRLGIETNKPSSGQTACANGVKGDNSKDVSPFPSNNYVMVLALNTGIDYRPSYVYLRPQEAWIDNCHNHLMCFRLTSSACSWASQVVH